MLASDRRTEVRRLSQRVSWAHGYASLNLAIDLAAHVQERQGTLRKFLRGQRPPAYDCGGVETEENAGNKKTHPRVRFFISRRRLNK